MDPLRVLQADSLRMMKDQHLYSANVYLVPNFNDYFYKIVPRTSLRRSILTSCFSFNPFPLITQCKQKSNFIGLGIQSQT